MRRHFAASIAFGLVGFAGCSSDPGPQELPTEASDEIINGQQDNANDAVVAVAGSMSICSGTIIAKVNTYGYVLTAAHCLDTPPQAVLQCDDYNGPCIQYNVDDYQADPLYDGAGNNDFGMIRIVGVGPGTPVLTAATAPDGVANGTQITMYGFGQTENNPNNSHRYKVTRAVSQTSQLHLQYNNQGQNGGMCFGDSGGPDITAGNVVVGVHSYITPDCLGTGVSGRVSARFATFIDPYIQGGPVGQLTCDQCTEASTSGLGACVGSVDACFNDQNCADLVQCFNACAANDQACINQCAQDNSAGLPLYQAIFDCVCDTGCTSECANDPMCQEPACGGFGAQDPECDACFKASCCNEAAACGASQACIDCMGQNPPPNCAQNQLANDFIDCLGNNCSVECGIGGGTTSSSSAATTGSGTGSGTGSATGAGGGNAGAGGGSATGAGGAGQGAGDAASGNATGATGANGANGATSGSGSGPSSGAGNAQDPGAEGSCSIEAPGSTSSAPAGSLLGIGLALLGLARRRRA